MSARALVDGLARLGHRGAHALLRAWWRVRQPTTHGALVAIWHEDALLLVRNSYVRFHSLPGGYVRRGESAAQAAARELGEELGLRLEPGALRFVLEVRHRWHHHDDHVTFFELEVDRPPAVKVDRREVVWAGFVPVAELGALELFPPIRQVVLERQRRAGLA